MELALAMIDERLHHSDGYSLREVSINDLVEGQVAWRQRSSKHMWVRDDQNGRTLLTRSPAALRRLTNSLLSVGALFSISLQGMLYVEDVAEDEERWLYATRRFPIGTTEFQEILTGFDKDVHWDTMSDFNNVFREKINRRENFIGQIRWIKLISAKIHVHWE